MCLTLGRGLRSALWEPNGLSMGGVTSQRKCGVLLTEEEKLDPNQVEKTHCALFQLPLEAQQNSKTSAFGQPLVPSEGDHSEPWIHSSLQ